MQGTFTKTLKRYETPTHYHQTGNVVRFNYLSSRKKLADRKKIYVSNPTDKSDKIIYQIGSDGKIVKTWQNIKEIADTFNIPPMNVLYYVKNNLIVGNNLFVKMFDYKSTTDYTTLIKYLKHKQK